MSAPSGLPGGRRAAQGGTRGALRLALLLALIAAAGAVVEHHESFAPLRVAVRRDPGEMPSTKLTPQDEIASGLAVVSLYVAPHDLHDPETGLLPNKLKHGREWERPGTVSFFEGGRLRFSSVVGVRLHGGGSRITVPEPGFRLYFRRQYGLAEAPGGVFFDPPHDHPLRRVVLHNDVRTDRGLRWHLVNPLAYDIASAIGAITAATRPARMFLNGEFQGVYVITEHFHPRDYFETHWRHPVVLSNREFDALWNELSAIDSPRMRHLRRLIDIDNLTRWMIATIFCATGDAFQGPGQFRDPTRSEGQWFWVNWDMDMSFRDWRNDTFVAMTERIGERRRGRRANEPRAYLFTRLLAEDPEYREYFMQVWTEAMNHRIPPSFLRERFRYYRDVAIRYGVEDRRYLTLVEEFVARRPAMIRRYAEQWLNMPPSVRLRLSGGSRAVLVDGWKTAPGYEGYYFPHMEVRLEVPAQDRPAFAYWRINGRVMRGFELTLTADRDLDVEVIWRNES
ncbi:MAG TPA: CotH kinase family protein [Vicinamibacterales bacterium]|nr:CotH kinase family protein [Vicinamibacterales bacterium]